jgi:Amt family ammonium transporter
VVFIAVWSVIVYAPMAHWVWGPDGFIGSELGAIDFAGGLVVHINAGAAALAAVLVLGPRIGFRRELMRPHALPLTLIGAGILWFGWFGFNAGSTTAASTDIALIAVNTNLSAAAGAVAAMVAAWLFLKKPDATMALNGALAGLVGITAGCANVTPGSSVIIGLVAGVLVVFSVLFFDRLRIDDPVGAISVHGVCGAWGTLAAGLFNAEGTSLGLIGVQLVGIVAAFLWTFGTMWAFFKIVAVTVGLRVSPEEEIEGLDSAEHGNDAYAADAFRTLPGDVVAGA